MQVQWQPSVLQPNYIFLQPNKQSSSFLLLFHVKEAGERNIITATKRGERQLATEL